MSKSLHCLICKKPIPPDARLSAVTCSKECSEAREAYLKRRYAETQCRYCQRPSTPEERARYLRWRQWERSGTPEQKIIAKLQREIHKLKVQAEVPRAEG